MGYGDSDKRQRRNNLHIRVQPRDSSSSRIFTFPASVKIITAYDPARFASLMQLLGLKKKMELKSTFSCRWTESGGGETNKRDPHVVIDLVNLHYSRVAPTSTQWLLPTVLQGGVLVVLSQFCERSSRMGWLWMVASQVYPYAGPLLMFWYPLVSSIMAIETQSKKDDQLWMTYWMVFALVSTVELIVAPVIPWIPFYSAVKLVVAAWLILPQSRGAIVLYKTLVHPFFTTTKITLSNGEHLHISADANESAALYIKEHGADAFEALLKSATSSVKVRKAENIEEVE